MAERYVTAGAPLKLPEICSCTKSTDLLLCDYVKLRKVRMGTQVYTKTATDKKLQVRIRECNPDTYNTQNRYFLDGFNRYNY